MKFKFLTSILIALLPIITNAQDGHLWKIIHQADRMDQRKIVPDKYTLVEMEEDDVKKFLGDLTPNYEHAAIISLPNPLGEKIDFLIWETPIMADELAKKFTNIQTFTAVSIHNKNVTAKIDFTEFGFHAMINDGNNTYFIDPITNQSSSQYQVYYKKDYHRNEDELAVCTFEENDLPNNAAIIGNASPLKLHGSQRKKYRLALACTGEYAQAVTGIVSPTKSEVLSEMVTTINRVNGIYEREIGVTLEIIANNDEIIYLNPTTDPFFSNFDGWELMDENQENTVSVIGTSNYDIGHIFSTGGGGIAALGSVCFSAQKARGVTGSPSPKGDSYNVDYVAHEMGHQFAANHTFNNCSGNENAGTAYEPGSGSTIMAYAGICGFGNNIQSNSNDYFHAASLLEITSNLSGTSPWGMANSCGTAMIGAVNITMPEISGTYNIPANCAFELTAPEATWIDGGTLSYCWEQWDLGNLKAIEINGSTYELAPVFRSYLPSSELVRSFPHRDSVLQNKYNYPGDRTPEITRSMKFKLTTRGLTADGWGNIHIGDSVLNVNVHNTEAIFTLTFPNASTDEWTANTTQNITWDPAGTTASPINCTGIDVLLSLDGGISFPFTIATNLPNTGAAIVNVPNYTGTEFGRVKIRGNNNIFYDVSNNNIKINGTPNAIYESDFQKQFSIYPNPANNVINIETTLDKTDLKYSLYNINGQQLLQQSSLSNSIDISGLASGIYLLEVKKGEARAVFKIVKK